MLWKGKVRKGEKKLIKVRKKGKISWDKVTWGNIRYGKVRKGKKRQGNITVGKIRYIETSKGQIRLVKARQRKLSWDKIC